jgi:hypothetical protein
MILHQTLPALPWMDPHLSRLPGVMPLADDVWLLRDAVFAPQMALRDQLIGQGAPVHGLLDQGHDAATECYDLILGKLARDPGYCLASGRATRPDGIVVALDRSNPLLTLGRLIQQDLCLMVAQEAEHVLAGAILCFPASWTLAEKLGQPMTRIHVPVPEYSPDLARRVQRMLDAVQPGRPLWRMNHNLYANPDLFHPRTESMPRSDDTPQYLRAERQCLVRLPQSRAVLFSIHTYVLLLADLPPDARDALFAAHA